MLSGVLWKGFFVLSLCMGLACKGQPKPQPPPAGQLALKVATIKLGGSNSYVRAWLLAPLTGEAFVPPKYAYHSTEVVAFDPKLPFPRSLRIIWTTWNGAFGPSGREGFLTDPQMRVDEWGHDMVIPVEGPVPEKPEHLLLVFYPEDKVKAEIISQAQMDAGRMEQVIEEFRNTWPGIIKPEKVVTKKTNKKPKKVS